MKLNAQLWGNEVFLSRDSFEDLLACLSNQKMLPLPDDQSSWEKIHAQEPIDDFYNQCAELLNHNGVEPEEDIWCPCYECFPPPTAEDYAGEWYG